MVNRIAAVGAMGPKTVVGAGQSVIEDMKEARSKILSELEDNKR